MNQCLCRKKYWYACSCFENINSEVSLAIIQDLTNIQIVDTIENINKDYLDFQTEQHSIINSINENKEIIKKYISRKSKLNHKINIQDINLIYEELIEFEKEKYKEFKVYQLAKERIDLVKLILMKKELKYKKVLEAANIISEVIKRMDDKRNAIEKNIFSRRSMKVRTTFAGGMNIGGVNTGNQKLRNTFYSPNARCGEDEQNLSPKVISRMPFRSFVSNRDFNENDFNERGCETFRKSTVVRHSEEPEHFSHRNSLDCQFSNLSLSSAKSKSALVPSIIIYTNYLITVINKKIVSFDINLNKFEDKIQSDLPFYDNSSYAQISPGEFFYLENIRDPKANLNNFYLINLNTNSVTVNKSPNILRYNVGCLGYCENIVYVFGGLNKENQLLKESECFSIDTGTWKSIESLPIPIAWASTVTQGKFIFICSMFSPRMIAYDTERNCYYYETHEKSLQIDKLEGKKVAFIFGYNDKVICSMGGKLFKGPSLWQQLTVNPNLEAATLMPRTWTQHGNYTYFTLDNKKIYQFNDEKKSIVAIADFLTRKTANDLASLQMK